MKFKIKKQLALIEDGAGSGNKASVDATSKALRISLYDTAGVPYADTTRPSYLLPVYIVFTGAIAANSYIFAIRNGGTKTIRITSFNLTSTFNGAVAAATNSRYRIERVTGVSATSGTGSTVLTPGRKNTSLAASAITEARLADGSANALTLTSGTVADILHEFGAQRGVNSVANAHFQLLLNFDPIALAAGTGNCFAIKAVNASVIGDGLTGWIEFSEI